MNILHFKNYWCHLTYFLLIAFILFYVYPFVE